MLSTEEEVKRRKRLYEEACAKVQAQPICTCGRALLASTLFPGVIICAGCLDVERCCECHSQEATHAAA